MAGQTESQLRASSVGKASIIPDLFIVVLKEISV